jgi:hypothetical protein
VLTDQRPTSNFFFPDDLHQSWASFEPSRTTVKRILLPECQKESMSGSSFSMNKQHSTPRMLDGSAFARPQDHTNPITFLYSSPNKGDAKLSANSKLFLAYSWKLNKRQ